MGNHDVVVVPSPRPPAQQPQSVLALSAEWSKMGKSKNKMRTEIATRITSLTGSPSLTLSPVVGAESRTGGTRTRIQCPGSRSRVVATKK